MEFKDRFNQLKKELEYIRNESNLLEKRIAETEKDYVECLAFTDKFLRLCKKYKITEVCIMAKNDIVKDSQTFVFGEYRSVFANSNDITNPVEEMGLWGGCSNYHQAQLNNEGVAKLINGAYQFKDGKWNKLD